MGQDLILRKERLRWVRQKEILQFLLDMIERFMQPGSVEEKTHLTSNRIGIAKGQDLYDDDFDETNPEIEKMFGGIE